MRSTFRLILKHLVENEHQRDYAPGGLEGKIILDPMMGGGTLHEAIRQWKPLAAIDKTDSLRFCESCATALGWMLNVDLTDAEIEPQWSRLLQQ